MKYCIPTQKGTAFRLQAGETLCLYDPQGGQVCDLFCFTDDEKHAPLSSGRSIDYNETIFFTTGHKLYSTEGEVLLEIQKDTCGRHDFLVTPCSLQMFQMMSGKEDYHPSCLENLIHAFRPFEIDPRSIGTTFNAFMNVSVDEKGKIKVLPPLSKAGDSIELLAKKDLLVGITACADEGSNGGRCKPILYEVLKS